MEITFYYAPMSSAVPVASTLAELDVHHQQVAFDLAKGDQRSPEFLRLNPNGKVPALVVDGTPMFEALAIMLWLGDRYGVAKGLWFEKDSPEYMTATAWSSWAYVSYGAVVRQLWLASASGAPAELNSSVWAEQARGALQDLLRVLDGHLAETGYIVGKRFSLADLIVSGVVIWSKMIGVSLSDHPHVSQWAATCAARPAIRKEYGDAA